MSTTVELFIDGLPVDEVRTRVEQCTGTVGEIDEYGELCFPLSDSIATLGSHRYVGEGDLDYASYTLEMEAKVYWYPDKSGPLASDSVAWFRSVFECLRGWGDTRLLLTYELEQVLDRYAPSS